MKGKGTLFAGFAAGLLILAGLDQWTKGLAVKHLMGKPPVVLVDGVFEFYYSENRGAAFGMLQGRQVFFFVIALAVLAAAVFLLARMPLKRRYLPMAGCILLVASGAAGNMIDRVSQGYVVDFLYFKMINFPIFNVADCYVTVGAALLVFLVFFYYKEEELACFSGRKGEGR